MNKRELYLHEKPILIFPARIQKTGYFTIPIKVIDQLEIDENYVVLFRLKDFPEYDLLSKVTSVRKTGNKELRLIINNSVRSKLNLILPKTIELEIMYIYKKGYKPCFDKIDGLIDILSYFFDDKRFTIFDRGNGYMTVHYLERSCPSIITIPKYLKIDEFSCWNFGFYLAEGTKHPKGYRFSADNAKEYLMERFRDFGENYLGIDRDEWFLDISTDQYHENKIDFWKRKLGINEDKIKLKVIKSKPPLAKYGNASLTIYDKILGFLIKKLTFTNMILLPLSVIQHTLDQFKSSKETKSAVYKTPKVINNLLIVLLNLEVFLLTRFYLPFGVGIFAVASKPLRNKITSRKKSG